MPALTRKFLSSLGVEEAQADSIIDVHTETVNRIQMELDEYKNKSNELESTQKKLERVQKELDNLKEATENGDNKDEYKDKYDELKKEFDDYKDGIKQKEAKDVKAKAFKSLLKEANIPEKRFDAIVKLSDDEIDKIEFDEDGETVKDKDNILKAISENWSEYVQSTGTKGADTATPPANNGGEDKKISRAKQIAQQYHDDLYGKVKED